jgi:hypothetical protein
MVYDARLPVGRKSSLLGKENACKRRRRPLRVGPSKCSSSPGSSSSAATYPRWQASPRSRRSNSRMPVRRRPFPAGGLDFAPDAQPQRLLSSQRRPCHAGWPGGRSRHSTSKAASSTECSPPLNHSYRDCNIYISMVADSTTFPPRFADDMILKTPSAKSALISMI